MIISVSAVLLLGVVLWLLIRYAGLKSWQALIAAAFGFFAASTAAAPQIRSALRALFRALSGH
jgi:hypothetical protein